VTFRLTDEAKQDFRDIQTYLTSQGSTKLARYVRGRIREALHFLADTPGAGHLRKDLTDRPVKFWPVFSYLIVYDPASRPISIARVLHSAQDLQTLLRNTPPRV
jgi:toxin ParE1/3/4